jgi:hypothetical protein
MKAVDVERYFQLLEREISVLFQEKKTGLVSKNWMVEPVYQPVFAFYA